MHYTNPRTHSLHLSNYTVSEKKQDIKLLPQEFSVLLFLTHGVGRTLHYQVTAVGLFRNIFVAIKLQLSATYLNGQVSYRQNLNLNLTLVHDFRFVNRFSIFFQ